MKHLSGSWLVAAALVGLLAVPPAPPAAATEPPEEPAHLALAVAPDSVDAGGVARVTLRIQPKSGVKINRYPKIKLEVPAQDELVEAANAEIGNDRPPPPDKMDTNYYETVDPLELDVRVSAAATSGRHRVEARVTYFYCVIASGFCAPKRVDVEIPLVVN